MTAIQTTEAVAALWFTGFFALCGLALIIGEASGLIKRRRDNDDEI